MTFQKTFHFFFSTLFFNFAFVLSLDSYTRQVWHLDTILEGWIETEEKVFETPKNLSKCQSQENKPSSSPLHDLGSFSLKQKRNFWNRQNPAQVKRLTRNQACNLETFLGITKRSWTKLFETLKIVSSFQGHYPLALLCRPRAFFHHFYMKRPSMFVLSDRKQMSAWALSFACDHQP